MPLKTDVITMWLSRIQRAESLQSEHATSRRESIKLYTGTFFGNPFSNSEELTEVNFVYEFLKILVGSIYARNPKIFVRANSSKYWRFAETMEQVINYYWKELQIKRKMKQVILDGVLQPPGFMEVGYTILTERKTQGQMIEENPGFWGKLLGKEKEEKVEEEKGILDETIKDDDVFANFIPSPDILWPDGYHNIRECPYIIKRQKIPYSDLLANPFYKKSKYDLFNRRFSSETKQKPTIYRMRDNPQVAVGVVPGQDLDLVTITLYHVWDRRSRKRFTLAQGYNTDTLYDGDWDYLTEGFTFYPLIFNDIPQTEEKANSYPLSDIVPMIPQLKELSYISSAMNRHRKRAGTLIFAKRQSINDTEATNIQQSGDVDLIFLDDVSENVLKGFTPPPIPRDFYELRSIVLEDLMRISGFNQLLYNVRGIETATESENVRAGSLIRQSEKVDIVEDFTVDVARGLCGLIWQFIQDKSRIEQIIGEPVSEDMWPTLPTDMKEARRIIQKELAYRIEAGSTRPPKDEAVERKQWLDLTGAIKANFPERVKDDVYLEQLLKKFDFKDIEEIIIKYDQEEIAAAQAENKLLMQGIPQVVGPNENDLLHLQVHAQVQQTPGMQPTPQLDEHIVKHAESMKRKSPTANPQRGDSKTPTQTTTPDLARGGVPEMADIIGSIRSQPNVGGNEGGQ